MEKILVVEDNLFEAKIIVSVLKGKGYEASLASDGVTGIRELENNSYDLVLTDLIMPDLDGMGVLNHVVNKCPKTKCIILTGHATIKSSVEAIKQGAFDYITKPIASTELLLVVEKALQFKNLEEENIRLKRELKKRYSRTNIIGTSKAMENVFGLIEKVADTDITVLIQGPSGTGKELIARAIHYDSDRGEKPLVVINCGAIPEALLESELFGHEKGSFTGAHKSRVGRFEMANGGTIFLDEIGEMSPALQVKLLRVLQDQRFERVGGTKTIHVDVRIIAATNKNLTVAINNNTFREDLYYRLNVIMIKAPPLKQRKSDIPLLVNYFMKKFQKKDKETITGFSPDAMNAMLEFVWPGNVRELENVIRQLVVLCENPIVEFEDLPEHIQQTEISVTRSEAAQFLEEGLSLDNAVKVYERKLIIEAMEKSNGIKAKAAKLLNIKRTTLVEKMKKQNFSKSVCA
ncbi:MAG: sigma-54 dependent transcriptional regulator [Proteobacteria bacterium]|nr:sigma-54 dependent transcriptional regulator [Pseudomonadota bacterium]